MNIVIISQARMNSSRLPGKVMKTILGKPLLQYHIERLRQIESMHQLVIATTHNRVDDEIVEFCGQLDIACYRGSEHDVLSRYFEAAELYDADVVVRVTSDCPVIDPEVVDGIIKSFVRFLPDIDYMSNTLHRTYPRGLDVEVFSRAVLNDAHQHAKAYNEREHVTPYIYHHPTKFKIHHYMNSTDYSHYRWTVDTQDDFSLIEKMIESLYPSNPNFALQDMLNVMIEHPDWYLINSHIEQKKV